MNAIIAQVNKSSTEQLVEMAKMLNSDLRDGTDTVLDAILRVLEDRLQEVQFVALCAELEA